MKKIRIGLNGYGRIGQSILRAFYERSTERLPMEIVAINAPGTLLINAHLTRYDTTHGKFPGSVEIMKDGLLINGQDYIRFFSEEDPKQLPWKALDIDIVYECTGRFTDRISAACHLQAGASKVLVSAPTRDADAVIVYGINHHLLRESEHYIVSMTSCTTNALAALIKPLLDHPGIEQGVMTTIHAYTSDQRLLDNHHTDLYRARSATQSMIPTKTGATSMIELIFSELKGKLEGLAIRVPIPNVSLLDFSFNTRTLTDTATINQILQTASKGSLKGILDYTDEPLVSSDFNHDPSSAIILTKETVVVGNLVKLLAWYDNEWGFSNRMLDITMAWLCHS
jgi:glyceraldehyde 3-phosphate dehydrogenase